MAKPRGYLFVDHRASPGIPADHARKYGLDPALVGEGKIFEADTINCAHCNGPKRLVPGHSYELNYCIMCGGDYICELCEAEKNKPDYKHIPFRKIVDLVATGEATALSLGVRPLLVPTRKKEL